MDSSFDNLKINDNNNSKNENNINTIHKNSNENNYNNEKSNIKNNTLNNFNTNISSHEKNILNNELKEIRPNHNNILEINETEEDKNNSLSSLIKDINFNNLNEYYEVQSSIFMKKIQKLNLKFYWTTEVFLNDKNIQYPYNKLFLILFKEISLYIDEIERLNKQLKLKTKNEKYYSQKISQLEQKEKNNMINKQTIKSLQRNNNLLQKTNDKYKINIEKLNKKLNYYNNLNKGNKNVLSTNNNNTNNDCKSLFGNQTMVNTTFDSITLPNSVILNSTKINSKRIRNSSNKKKNIKNNEFKEILKNGIEECDEELKNLSKIEELLLFGSKKQSRLYTGLNSRKKLLDYSDRTCKDRTCAFKELSQGRILKKEDRAPDDDADYGRLRSLPLLLGFEGAQGQRRGTRGRELGIPDKLDLLAQKGYLRCRHVQQRYRSR